MTKHTILFLAANPHGADQDGLALQARRSAFDQEESAIRHEMERSVYRDRFQLVTRWAAEPRDLLRELRAVKPVVVHFSGNGGRDGLFFQAPNGDARIVSPTAIAETFGAAGGSVKLVVLSACYGEAVAEALLAHVDCIVGMNGVLRDDMAKFFAAGFYGALVDQESVAVAYRHGNAAIRLEQLSDAERPQLKVRAGADADRIILSSSSRSRRTRRHTATMVTMAQSPGLGAHTFVGRERELAEIEALLTGAKDGQLRVALDGLPGIGKTELARQVVARLARGKQFPGGIFWFNAENADLRMQWAKLTEDSGGPDLPELDARAAWAVQQLKQRAQHGDAVLIVLDNVESWAPPPSPLPDVSAIRLLVTTRMRWLHNSFRPYEVQPLGLGHARELLHAIVGRELAHVDALLRALGGHVLSIELAATYLREYGTSSLEYLKQLAAGKSPGSSVADQTSYRATAETAFRLIWRRIAPGLREAWLLAAQLPPAWFTSELAEAVGLDAERRRGLVRLHILERDAQGRHLMHRLLREFALAEEPETTSLREAVIRGATELLDSGDPALIFQRYRRDVDSFEHLVAMFAAVPGCARLMRACGRGLRQRGDLPAARVLLEQALASDLKTYGDDHPEVATDRNSLAVLLQQLGDLPAARVLLEQALTSNLKTYGDDHPEVVSVSNNLARLLQELGDLQTARVLYERALAFDLKTYGHDHPKVALRRNNLAGVLKGLGDLPAARALFEQALASTLEAYGEDHPDVITDRNNLAGAFRALGDLPAARVLVEQALESAIKTYGDDHPMVASCRNSLAVLLLELGELSAARVLVEQALASDLKTYGDDHPVVATRRNNLARVLQRLGDLPAARALFERALASVVAAYGDNHPIVVKVRAYLAALISEAHLS